MWSRCFPGRVLRIGKARRSAGSSLGQRLHIVQSPSRLLNVRPLDGTCRCDNKWTFPSFKAQPNDDFQSQYYLHRTFSAFAARDLKNAEALSNQRPLGRREKKENNSFSPARIARERHDRSKCYASTLPPPNQENRYLFINCLI